MARSPTGADRLEESAKGVGASIDEVERLAAEGSDYNRGLLPEGLPRLAYDVFTGTLKGYYRFTKATVTGLLDLAGAAWRLVNLDRETWNGALSLAKETYWLTPGLVYPPLLGPMLLSQHEKIARFATGLFETVKKGLRDEWDEAGSKGKRAELIARWESQGALEVASFFVGAGEIKAALKGGKAVAAAKKTGQAAAKTGLLEPVRMVCTHTPEAQQAARASKQSEAVRTALEKIAKGRKRSLRKAALKAYKKSGMTRSAFARYQEIALKPRKLDNGMAIDGVRIRIRPTKPDAAKWRRLGHSPKPHPIPNKGIDNLDIMLGPPPKRGTKALTGCYNPKEFTRLELEEKLQRRLTDKEWAALEKRIQMRRKEYAALKERWETDPNVSGQYELNEGEGTIIDMRAGSEGKGKAITSDYDAFDISYKDDNGKWVLIGPEEGQNPKLFKEVIGEMDADPHIRNQHETAATWDTTDPYYNSEVDATVKKKHTSVEDKGEGEALIDIRPDKEPGRSYYDPSGGIPD